MFISIQLLLCCVNDIVLVTAYSYPNVAIPYGADGLSCCPINTFCTGVLCFILFCFFLPKNENYSLKLLFFIELCIFLTNKRSSSDN